MIKDQLISILIPMKNESESIRPLMARLLPILNRLTYRYEIVAINDGSTDNTLDLLLEYKNQVSQLKIVDLSRNFGKEAALYAGFAHCSGDCAISIDSDLQDPPELISEMVLYWSEGYEVVTAVRDSRTTDAYFKRKTAVMFYNLINKIGETKLTPNAGDYRLLDRAAINAFLQLGERVRFNKGLFSWIGFKEKLIYHHRESRLAGKTNWNYWKLFRFSIDGITSFSKAPLEAWFYLGILVSGTGFIYGVYYLIRTLLIGIDVHGYPSILIFILFFSGLQMIGIGVLGKYIGRIFIESKHRPIYILRKFYD
jgi:glycosyltransferase involved in cell wall biosynthesis